MNKIDLPIFDDDKAFNELANNSRVSSYPQLKHIIPSIHAAYANYISVGGKPNLIQGPNLPAKVGDFLRGHYASPPAVLAHIDKMRAQSGHLTCPMCGSLHSGTLDHYLPQKKYAAYAVFSKNLIPACKCNIKRKDVIIGVITGQRIMHPYFDRCLKQRLLRAQFDDLGEVPRVTIRVLVDSSHPDYQAIKFHFDSIVMDSGIVDYLADRWSSLITRPSSIVRYFENNIVSVVELRRLLKKELQLLDQAHKGKNNWNSIFVAGLLEAPVLAWLKKCFSRSGRVADSPLV